MLTADDLRQKYLDFFKSKGHSIIPSASLIPENDPTVLFTTAGMHPLVPYLMGEKHPEGTKIADSQKCIRTGDIDDVGDNRHLTFFEMLGNWSLGDYFKREAIEWSWEFMTDKKWLGLNPERIYVTVFMGDDNSPIDEESIAIWKEQYEKVGMDVEVCPYNEKIAGNSKYRIFPLTTDDNWWGPAGKTGPCGPCTEMFYDTKFDGALEGTFDEEIDAFRVMEIWNDVFMEFNKQADGSFEKLSQKNVDTGMGLERTITVLSGKQNVFDTEFFTLFFEKLNELSGKEYGESDEIDKSMRIIADHIKAATFIMGDRRGVTPSNVDQGYVVRRLIRRALRHGKQLGINQSLWTKEIAEIAIKLYGDFYTELVVRKDVVFSELDKEEEKFTKTLEKGLKELDKIVDGSQLSGQDAFNLYQTYGFPVEIVNEELRNRGIKEIDEKEFKEFLEKHQELSRTASAGRFKGGLADASEETTALHTAAHLLLEALRRVLGDHVEQRGSNITAERLRFDFSNPEKMTDEQKTDVEKIVNEQIEKSLIVNMQEMTLDEAKNIGASGIFESKYGEKVKVYAIGAEDDIFSHEICGGPHVNNLGGLGKFKIKKESSSSAGVRRIKAVLEK